jgi:hypothetical protein
MRGRAESEHLRHLIFDYDHDVWPDLYVSGYSFGSPQDVGRFESGQPFDAGLPHLYHNRGDGTFTDVTHAMHLDRAILPMRANLGDLDNDGWPDVYLGTREASYQACYRIACSVMTAASAFRTQEQVLRDLSMTRPCCCGKTSRLLK